MSEITAAIGHHDLDSGWATYKRLIDAFTDACNTDDTAAARSLLNEARSTWQHHHDRACDTICALFDVAATALGEPFVGELWDVLLAGMMTVPTKLYDPVNVSWAQSVERLLLDIFEATRGHLTGPRRDGAFSIAEEDERWVITFAPCGSGGRTYELSPDGPRSRPNDMTGRGTPRVFACTARIAANCNNVRRLRDLASPSE